jgi:diaminopropionate ammonia-lyase
MRALLAQLGEANLALNSLDGLAERVRGRGLVEATATDGNHGRAVAHMARRLGLAARVFVPAGTAAKRIAAFESEGASCQVVDGTYEDAVAAAAAHPDVLVVSDTSWEGYEDVPRWILEGYATTVLLLSTEGATDGVGYRAVVGSSPEAVAAPKAPTTGGG